MWESFWNTTWEILGPMYAAVLPLIVMAVGGYLADLYRKKTGQEMNAIFRDALQGTIARTANTVVVKAGGAAALNSLPADALELGVKLVKEAVPEAVAHFQKQGLTDEKIAEKLKPQAEAIIAASPLAPEVKVVAAAVQDQVQQALLDPATIDVPIGKVLDQIIKQMPPLATGKGG
jgi:hypothetical protein